MTKPFAFEKPIGMRDVLPEMVYQKQKIVTAIWDEVLRWGYDPIETPTLEFYDTVGGVSPTLEQRLFKLLDHTGHTLVMRPDLTTPIARVVSSLLKEQPFPIRLAYEGNVFRAQENEAGRHAEFPEVGIELIGEEAPDADAEVITLAVAALQAAGVSDFQLTIGHPGFIDALFHEVLSGDQYADADRRQLKQYLYAKNIVGYKQWVDQNIADAQQRQALVALLNCRGSFDQLEQALPQLPASWRGGVLQELRELWSVLTMHGVESFVFFDLSLVSHMEYYTGIYFEGYADKLGFPLCSGGRYDHLLGQFGHPAPATGFALKVDRLLEACHSPVQHTPEAVQINYTDSERQEAFEQARKLRAAGRRVTLHRTSSGGV